MGQVQCDNPPLRRNNRLVKVYLDMCCLTRPFDDQSQPRIRIETEAVLALLSEPDRLAFVASPAHALENRHNPVISRAARVRAWLDAVGRADLDRNQLEPRTEELMAVGFRPFDALHVACAEQSAAEVFVTTDDRLLATARRAGKALRVRVTDPVTLVQEVFG